MMLRRFTVIGMVITTTKPSNLYTITNLKVYRTIQDLNFLPGETRVKAVNDKLKLLHNDTSQCYSADVILPLQSTSLEIV